MTPERWRGVLPTPVSGGMQSNFWLQRLKEPTGTEIFMILRSRLSNVIDDETVPPVHKSDAEGPREIVAHALKQ